VAYGLHARRAIASASLMTSTTAGQLEARAFSSAGLMKAKIARDTKAKLHQKARAGHAVGATVFGYNLIDVDGHRERSVNAEQAKAVVRVFEMSAAGFGNRRIVTALNAESVPRLRLAAGRRRRSRAFSGVMSTSGA
jgi:DNA invertase Pin-like site-specific DNA recombinase